MAMKRSIFSVLTIALLIAGESAYADRPATQPVSTSTAPKSDIAVQVNGVTKPSAAPKTNMDASAESEVTPAAALRLMVLRWLVTR